MRRPTSARRTYEPRPPHRRVRERARCPALRGLKREIGEPVCVTAGIHQAYGVRVCSDALIDQLFGEGFRQLEGSP